MAGAAVSPRRAGGQPCGRLADRAMVADPSSGFPPRPARSRSIDEDDVLANAAKRRRGLGRAECIRFFQDDQSSSCRGGGSVSTTDR